ncbi:MAG TPA: ATPase [Bacteroidetes bacterium]|nr:ATPase [Candidatus Limimorpha avicola]
MTKLSILIYHRDYQSFLEKLRQHGVVHVHPKKTSLQDERYRTKLNSIKQVSNLIKQLEKLPAAQNPVDTELRNEALYNFIDDKFKEIESLQQQLLYLQKEDSVYGLWGKYPEKVLDDIKANNWDIRFFTVPARKYDNKWEEDFNAFVINELAGLRYFTTITPKGKDVDIEADTFTFPAMTKQEIDKKLADMNKIISDTNRYLSDVAPKAVQYLKEYVISIKEDNEFFKVSDAAEHLAEEKLMSLEGWVPTEIQDNTIKWLDSQEVYYEASKPVINQDNPPIKLKNNRFARLFEFIGDMYSIPSYWEIDLTPFFAPFFVMFFGFCMGDAGYGLLMIAVVVALLLSGKMSKMRPVMWLGFFLGIGTTIMGTISGTFFGIELMKVDIPFVNSLKGFMFREDGWYSAFYFSLILGVVQIIFGMCLKVVNLTKMYGFASSLPTIGWIVLILGGILSYLIAGVGLPLYICAGVGAVLIFLLNGPITKIYSPFVNIGSGLWDTYNMLTGLLGDILSYIRLFALGLSGSILGLVFNDLAMRMSGNIPVVSTIIMLLILLFGHAMNIALSGLSAFVHPMRLTFVEFYKNAGFVGGGKKYDPFRDRTHEDE